MNGYNVAVNPLTTYLCCGGGIPSFSSTRSFILSTWFEMGEQNFERPVIFGNFSLV